MQSLLTLSAMDRQLVFDQAAAQRGWVASSVEKDFWVCWTLRRLFELSEIQGHLTFKGGTSLSKAWGLIDRFSEDIDLTISRHALGFDGERSPEHAVSPSQQRKRIKRLRQVCSQLVRDVVQLRLSAQMHEMLGREGWSLVMDKTDPDGQTLLFQYPTCHPTSLTRYVRPVVKIEFGARSDPWPAQARTIRPVIAEVFPDVFIHADTVVQAIAPERTFWEKAMLLHEETYRPADRPRGARMARHYYDLYRLIRSGVGASACKDPGLFTQILDHRQVFFFQRWIDYSTLAPGMLRLLPLPEQEAGWRDDYLAMQSEMFSITPPSFEELLASAREFETAFNTAYPRA